MVQNKIVKPGMKPAAGQKAPRPVKVEGTSSKRQADTHAGKNRSVNHNMRGK